jgi:hypothetical protein
MQLPHPSLAIVALRQVLPLPITHFLDEEAMMRTFGQRSPNSPWHTTTSLVCVDYLGRARTLEPWWKWKDPRR